MIKLSCLIIEDEVILADVLKDYISQVPFLELKSIFHDGIAAIEYLEENEVNLIFIDIHLPNLKGIDFIKMFRGKSRFIITTAYHEYALQGYELDVVDYLMKPVAFTRFLQAVKKALDLFAKVVSKQAEATKPETKDFIFVNINKRRLKINFNDILYIEGMKEYVKIFLTKEKYLITKLQMSQINELLNQDFVRIHRSYIVAKKKVSSYNLTEVNIGTIMLPVGINYRDTIASQLEA